MSTCPSAWLIKVASNVQKLIPWAFRFGPVNALKGLSCVDIKIVPEANYVTPLPPKPLGAGSGAGGKRGVLFLRKYLPYAESDTRQATLILGVAGCGAKEYSMNSIR
jgi:hypothetical protein